MGIVVMYAVAILLASLGVAMLRFADYWVLFFRQARTGVGRAANRRLITRSTITFQAVLLLVFSGVLLFVATSALVNS